MSALPVPSSPDLNPHPDHALQELCFQVFAAALKEQLSQPEDQEPHLSHAILFYLLQARIIIPCTSHRQRKEKQQTEQISRELRNT